MSRGKGYSRQLRESARHASCAMCGAKETVVLAHRNLPGHFGIGMKAPDWMGARLCFHCHSYGDSEGRKDHAFWERAIVQTWREWINEGLITVKGLE